MRNLAIKERDLNYNQFMNQMKIPSSTTNIKDDEHYNKELELLKGFEQNKKTCFVRPPDNISFLSEETLLNNELLFKNKNELFNIQTKIR
jgi:hypothetical protein